MASHTSDPFYQLQKLTKELLGSELKSANHDAKLTFVQTTTWVSPHVVGLAVSG